jgi:uncharacterized protein
MKKFIVTFFTCFISFVLFAQNGFEATSLLKGPPAKQSLVNDYIGILTPDQKHSLEQKLIQFDDSTSTQIAVVIIPSTDGDDIASYNVKLGRAWGVGGAEFNNGVILLIAKDDRKLNIATGYGVEGALPDITCKHIIDEVIVPNFKGNDYYRGIDEGVDAIIQATKGEYKAPKGYKTKELSLGRIIFIIILIIIFLIIVSNSGGGGSFMSRRGHGPIFWNPGGGGFGGGGSSSGGGFGGFGGGSFGGGGASGSW